MVALLRQRNKAGARRWRLGIVCRQKRLLQKRQRRDAHDRARFDGYGDFGRGQRRYTAGMETAYLSITTVRGWYAYNDIGKSSIYSGAFRGGSTGHTLSDKGARYMIRSIDGLNFGLTNGTMTDSAPLYFAESFSGRGEAEIPVLSRYTVLGGIEEDKTLPRACI